MAPFNLLSSVNSVSPSMSRGAGRALVVKVNLLGASSKSWRKEEMLTGWGEEQSTSRGKEKEGAIRKR